MKTTQDKIYKNQTGTAQPHVYSKDLHDLKILIPSLEKQQEIVEYCEYNSNLIKQLEREIENNKRIAQQFITNIVVNSKNNDEIKQEHDNKSESNTKKQKPLIIEDSDDEEELEGKNEF